MQPSLHPEHFEDPEVGGEGISTGLAHAINAATRLDDCTSSASWYPYQRSLVTAWARKDPKLCIKIDARGLFIHQPKSVRSIDAQRTQNSRYTMVTTLLGVESSVLAPSRTGS